MSNSNNNNNNKTTTTTTNNNNDNNSRQCEGSISCLGSNCICNISRHSSSSNGRSNNSKITTMVEIESIVLVIVPHH